MLVPSTQLHQRPTVKLNGLKGDKNSFKMPAARSHAHDFGYEALRLRAYGLLCISIFSRRINVCHYLTHLSTYIHTSTLLKVFIYDFGYLTREIRVDPAATADIVKIFPKCEYETAYVSVKLVAL